MFKGDLEVDLDREMEGDSKGDFKQDLEGDFLSSSGQDWLRLQLKFNSLELDSDNLLTLSFIRRKIAT